MGKIFQKIPQMGHTCPAWRLSVCYHRAIKDLCGLLIPAAADHCYRIRERTVSIMLNIRDLKIDNASLGQKKLLVDVVPAYEYKDNKRTDNITGYRYVICLVEHHLEKLSVRIDGPQLMTQPEGFVEVEFDKLEVSVYESQGKVQFTAKATGIYAV